MGATESKVVPEPTTIGAPMGKGIKGEADPITAARVPDDAAQADPAATDAKDTKEAKPEKVEKNDYELAIKSCKELEFILETEFGSSGTTLHEMITNANASLPIELIMNMRYVATIANNLVHEKSFSYIPDQEEFIKRYERSVRSLQEISQQRRVVEKRVVEAKRKKREAEIQEELMNDDKVWLDEQQKQVTAAKARRMEVEREKEKQRILAMQKQQEAEAQAQAACSCF